MADLQLPPLVRGSHDFRQLTNISILSSERTTEKKKKRKEVGDGPWHDPIRKSTVDKQITSSLVREERSDLDMKVFAVVLRNQNRKKPKPLSDEEFTNL